MNLTKRPIFQKDEFTDATEKAFLRWLRTLCSAIDQAKDDIVAAHVRRVNQGSGIATKPKLYAIPLTREQHDFQHQHGELKCLIHFTGRNWTLADARKWFEDQAFFYRNVFLDEIWGKQ